MRIEYKYDDMFGSDAWVLINPVNTKSAMGAGLAAKFKKLFPEMFEDYVCACRNNTCAIGHCHTYWDDNAKKLIINFPTKDHWKDPSEMEYIDKGMKSLVEWIIMLPTDSAIIAIPALGAGIGGLNWDEVLNVILENLEAPEIKSSHHTFYIYPPQ